MGVDLSELVHRQQPIDDATKRTTLCKPPAGTGQRKVARKGSWLDKLRESRTSRKPLPAAAHQHQAKSNGSQAGAYILISFMLVLLYCTIPGNSERISFAGEARTQLPVLYKYKEGFTNAVKRPVVMKDLL